MHFAKRTSAASGWLASTTRTSTRRPTCRTPTSRERSAPTVDLCTRAPRSSWSPSRNPACSARRSSSGTRRLARTAGGAFVSVARAAWLCIALAACSGSISDEELPTEPIAFVRQAAAEGISSLEDFRKAARIEDQDKPDTTKPKLQTTLSLLAPESGEFRPIPDAGLGTIPFDWSRDGTHLLVGRVAQSDDSLSLYTWNRLSGAWARVRRGPVGNGAGIAAGPIRLVWHGVVREAKGFAGAIWAEVDARGAEVLPGTTGGAEPDVSPDGRTVVFSRGERRAPQGPTIFLEVLGETEPHPLTRGSHPRFSRDGKWITFLRKTDGNTDVWIMRADGSAKRPVTKTGYNEESPAISPDGRFVAYASARGTPDESLLYVARVSDGAERELVHSGLNARPVW